MLEGRRNLRREVDYEMNRKVNCKGDGRRVRREQDQGGNWKE